jgi:hypothetical protein
MANRCGNKLPMQSPPSKKQRGKVKDKKQNGKVMEHAIKDTVEIKETSSITYQNEEERSQDSSMNFGSNIFERDPSLTEWIEETFENVFNYGKTALYIIFISN